MKESTKYSKREKIHATSSSANMPQWPWWGEREDRSKIKACINHYLLSNRTNKINLPEKKWTLWLHSYWRWNQTQTTSYMWPDQRSITIKYSFVPLSDLLMNFYFFPYLFKWLHKQVHFFLFKQEVGKRQRAICYWWLLAGEIRGRGILILKQHLIGQ